MIRYANTMGSCTKFLWVKSHFQCIIPNIYNSYVKRSMKLHYSIYCIWEPDAWEGLKPERNMPICPEFSGILFMNRLRSILWLIVTLGQLDFLLILKLFRKDDCESNGTVRHYQRTLQYQRILAYDRHPYDKLSCSVKPDASTTKIVL